MSFRNSEKRTIATIFLTIILFSGCCSARIGLEDSASILSEELLVSEGLLSEDDESEDENSEEISFFSEENFEEDDIYAQMFNDYLCPTHIMEFYRFIYKTDDSTYVTTYSDEHQCYGLYQFTEDGEKKYIADNGWCCYIHDDVLYYLEYYLYEEDGALMESYNCIRYQNGEKEIIEVDFFSDSGIYYSVDNVLYKSSYDGNENTEIYKPTEGFINRSLEYDHYLWVLTHNDDYNFILHKLSLDGTEISSIPIMTNDISVRNHYIYFHDYSSPVAPGKFFRYSMLTGEVEELPNINEYMEPVCFTDDYIFFEKHDGLYRADKNFDNIKMIISYVSADAINTFDNYIYVLYYNKDVRQYDTDGNLIRVYN